jgi:predicted HTH domain antitoxin
MSSTVSIQVSREIIHATRITPQELARELAIHLFQQGKLSFGKAREMADMSVWTFQPLLGSGGMNALKFYFPRLNAQGIIMLHLNNGWGNRG